MKYKSLVILLYIWLHSGTQIIGIPVNLRVVTWSMVAQGYLPKIRGSPHKPFQVSNIKYGRIYISMVEVPLIDESIFPPKRYFCTG
jgi:hypothetical protein